MSVRGNEWVNFSMEVSDHIERYTIPQYGDYPNDQCAEDFDLSDVAANIKRYANRMGKGKRGLQEQLRDCLKIAHYACIAYSEQAGLDPSEL